MKNPEPEDEKSQGYPGDETPELPRFRRNRKGYYKIVGMTSRVKKIRDPRDENDGSRAQKIAWKCKFLYGLCTKNKLGIFELRSNEKVELSAQTVALVVQ